MGCAYADTKKNSVIPFILLIMRTLFGIDRESWVRFTDNTQFSWLSVLYCTLLFA